MFLFWQFLIRLVMRSDNLISLTLQATVRLVINYKKTQKTILRVSPRVPLEDLLPAICEKCEFDRQSTLLLRDAQSEDPLDLTWSLNDFAIREVYARDTKGKSFSLKPSAFKTFINLNNYYTF